METLRTVHARLLGLQLAAGDAMAVRLIESALRQAKGSVRKAATILGVTEKSIHVWLKFPALAKAAKLRQGREAIGKRSRKVSGSRRQP
jgi:hypothetical protein